MRIDQDRVVWRWTPDRAKEADVAEEYAVTTHERAYDGVILWACYSGEWRPVMGEMLKPRIPQLPPMGSENMLVECERAVLSILIREFDAPAFDFLHASSFTEVHHVKIFLALSAIRREPRAGFDSLLASLEDSPALVAEVRLLSGLEVDPRLLPLYCEIVHRAALARSFMAITAESVER